MSFAGKRAMVCMKHVGLNVASDAFINSAITGANGGLVVVVADDPSMHSSQNEQDSRFYGAFAQVPFFEPSNQQEAYDIVLNAFELSERHAVPILVRLTTRMAHSRADVIRRVDKPRDQKPLKFPSDRAGLFCCRPSRAGTMRNCSARPGSSRRKQNSRRSMSSRRGEPRRGHRRVRHRRELHPRSVPGWRLSAPDPQDRPVSGPAPEDRQADGRRLVRDRLRGRLSARRGTHARRD